MGKNLLSVLHLAFFIFTWAPSLIQNVNNKSQSSWFRVILYVAVLKIPHFYIAEILTTNNISSSLAYFLKLVFIRSLEFCCWGFVCACFPFHLFLEKLQLPFETRRDAMAMERCLMMLIK